MPRRRWTFASVVLAGCFVDADTADVGSTDDADTASSIATSPGTGDATGSSTADASGDSEGTGSGSSETTASVEPICGDGAVEGEEACDDGNELDWDGCSTACTVTAERRWTFVEDGGMGLDDAVLGVAVDPGGDVYVGGYVRKETGVFDYVDQWTARLQGGSDDVAWEVVQEVGTGDDAVYAVAQSSRGEIVTGGYFGDLGGVDQPDLRRRDAATGTAGDVLGVNVSGPGRVWDLAALADGSIIAVGGVTPTTSVDIWIARYAADGTAMWSDIVDADGGEDLALGVEATATTFVVAGHVTVGGQTNRWVRQYYHSGAEHWTVSDDAGSDANVFAVAYASDDSVVLAGSVAVDGHGLDAWVGKYSASGVPVWETTYHGGNGDDVAAGVAVTSSDDVYACGSASIAGRGDDIWVARYGSDGTSHGVLTHDEGASERELGRDCAATEDGGVVVGGVVTRAGTGVDLWVSRYGP